MLTIRCGQNSIDSIRHLSGLLGWRLRSWLKGQVGCSAVGRIYFLTLKLMKGWIEVLFASCGALSVANALR